MSRENPEAKFSIKVETNAGEVADRAAGSLEGLRQHIATSEASIRDMVGSLRRLRGTSDDVKSAKDALKAKIDAERNAMSAASLSLLKAGSSYEALSNKTKKLATDQGALAAKTKANGLEEARARTGALGAAVRAAGGPVEGLYTKFESLKTIAGGASSAVGAFGIAAIGVAGAVVALAGGIGAAAFALGKFVLESGNAARSANLLREAATGTAENAYNLGTQVDALAVKVPTAKTELNALAVSLAKNGLEGQALVDTLNAVGQASAALGDDAGKKLEEFVERGRLSRRFFLSPLELVGTGLKFDDVAKSLSRSMQVSINDARSALFEGRVSIGDGAAALRDAVETKFAGINLRKMLDLDVLGQKLKETVSALTVDVDLEPLLEDVKELFSLADSSTVSGSALKQLVTLFGTEMVSALHAGAPLAIALLKNLILESLDVAIAVYKVRNAFTDAFADKEHLKNIDGMALALNAVTLATESFGAGVRGSVGIAINQLELLATVADAVVGAFDTLQSDVVEIRTTFDALRKVDGASIAANIIDGLLSGLERKEHELEQSVKALADRVKGAFTGALEIHSPSRVFAEYGDQTVRGYAAGLERSAPRAADAVEELAMTPRASRSSSPSAPTNITVHVHIQGLPSAAEMQSPSFLAQLTRAIEEALLGAGIPRS